MKNIYAAILTVILNLAIGNALFAQAFVNGGFAGPENYGTVAPSWTMTGGSPDMVNIPSVLAPALTYTAVGATVSSEGGTFQLLYENTTSTYTEKQRQTVAGFVIGNTYTVTWEEGNFGPCYTASCYTSTGEMRVNISGVGTLTSGNILAVDPLWKDACVTFVATSTSHNIEWEANCLSGAGSGAWMAFDNVQLFAGGGGGGGSAGFGYPNDTLCTSAGPVAPTITGTAGGTFTFSPAGLTISAGTGVITPSTSTPGTYDVTYTITGCGGSDSTVTIEIVTPPTADFEYVPSVFCANDPDPLPDFDTDGDMIADGTAGTFSSTAGLVINASTGAIDLSASTPGTYVVTNTVNAPGCTPAVFNFNVTVNPVPAATMSADESICGGGVFADIVFVMTAGTAPWSVDYTFDGTPLTESPVGASPYNLPAVEGTYIFTSITDANGCVGTLSSTVVKDINSLEAADFEYNGPYCANGTDPSPDYDTDEDVVADGICGVFTFTPAGLVINPLTGDVDLGLSTPGTYTVTNTVTSPGCGVVTYDAIILINALPSATITGDEQVCDGLPFGPIQFDITAGTSPWTIDYTLDGAPVSAAGVAVTPHLVPAVEGVYAGVTITDANGCTNTIPGTATKTSLPVPVITPVLPFSICDNTAGNIPNFSSDVPGSVFTWTNTSGTDIGFGLSGSGNIGSFSAINATGASITVTISVTATSAAGCVSLPITFDVTVNPTPSVSFNSSPVNGCAPVSIDFYNLTTPSSSGCNWTFGDGGVSTGCGTVSHIFQDGTFDVSLTVVSADRCTASVTYLDYIVVTPAPVAHFNATPTVTDIENTKIIFTNTSIDADNYEWDFDDGSPYSTVENPDHTYPDVPHDYLVTLWAYANGGVCKDSISVLIQIEDIILFYVPNVFTPDGNGVNESFKPVFTSGFDPYDYHLTMFNRWGEVVFESYNATFGWDGSYGHRGLVEDGTYIWQIEFKETMSDKRHKHRGHVTILK